jgi:hypothetical protein
MTSLQVVLVMATAVWLLVLTVTLLATVRQTAIIMVRLERDLDGAPAVGDGLEVGSELPAEIAELIEQVPERPSFVLVLASVCNPCRELAPQLAGLETSAPMTVLITGNDRRMVHEILELVPPAVHAVNGDAADKAVRALRIATTPFVFEFRADRLAAKAAVRGFDHFQRYVGEAESVATSDLRSEVEVAP